MTDQSPAPGEQPPADRPVYDPAEIRPPKTEANSFGGIGDAEDGAPSAANPDGESSAHPDEGWRGIDPARP